MASSIELASSSSLSEAEKLSFVELLSSIMKHAWSVGSLFFGLWLLPMGYIITSSKCMPVWLGRTIIIGGIGYLISAFCYYLGIKGDWLSILTFPSIIGEFWMIGYLLSYGIRKEHN